MPRVSIIVVNLNGLELLPECINSVQHQSYSDFELILVDNGSSDGSADFVENAYPFVTVIRLQINRGFTGGNIEGLKHAHGEFIVLLNNDAIMNENWLQSMVAAMDQNINIGTCSSKIIIHGTNIIDSAGNRFTTAGSGVKIGETMDADAYGESMETWGACAAAVMYRRKMLDEVGFLDDDLFLNYEDTDLDFRTLLAGWKSMFVPEAVVYHKVSSTIGSLSDTAVYYFARNSVIVWLKNMPGWLMVRYIHHRLLYEISTFIYYGLIHGKYLPFLRGKCGALRILNSTLIKRRSIQKAKKVTNRHLQSVFSPLPSTVLRKAAALLTTNKES